MKKYILPFLLVLAGCGDIITKIEKEKEPAYEVKELSHIQVTKEEAQQDILDCTLYLYLQDPFDDVMGNGQMDYINSVSRLTGIAQQYAQREQDEKAKILFDAAHSILKNYINPSSPHYLSRLQGLDQAQPTVDLSKETDDAVLAIHHAIVNSTRPYKNRGWSSDIAPHLLQTKRFDLVQEYAPHLFEHDRIEILSKTVMAMHDAGQIDPAQTLAESLHNDLHNIDNRERRMIPKQKLNSYAHVIGAFHALGRTDVCEALMSEMHTMIQSDPPLRTRDFIEAAQILAADYQLFDESISILQIANGQFDSVKDNELYPIANAMLEANRFAQANEVTDAMNSSYYKSLIYKNAVALTKENEPLQNQYLDLIRAHAKNPKDSSGVIVKYQLAKCYALIGDTNSMYDVLVQAIRQLNNDRKIIRNINLGYASAILSEYNYPTNKAIQAELKKIIDKPL